MTCLSRESLLKKEDLKIEKVQLGGDDFVFVRQMNGRERDRFEQSIMKEMVHEGKVFFVKNIEDYRAKLAVNTVCDENGNLILEPLDYEVLSQNISAAKLELIVNTAQSLSKITTQDRDKLLGNSEGGKRDSSISASAEN